jgi:hypothetical protein
MSDDRWLERAPVMVGGLFDCAHRFDRWKNWEWLQISSDEANLSDTRALYQEFVAGLTIVGEKISEWRALPPSSAPQHSMKITTVGSAQHLF